MVKKSWRSGEIVLAILLCLTMLFTLIPSVNASAAHKKRGKERLNVTKVHLHWRKTYKLKLVHSKRKVRKWTSSNKKVVTVSSKGKLTGKKTGKATIKAYVGKKVYKVKVVVPKHKIVKTLRKATSHKKGKVRVYCPSCKKKYTCYTPKHKHKWVKRKVVKPSCYKKGYTLYVCKSNKKHTRKKYKKAVGHHTWDDGTITRQPTSSQTGRKHFTCLVCKATKDVELAKTAAEYTLKTSKTDYDYQEDIKVTASGPSGSRVACFLADDDIKSADPIYQYPVTENGFRSGATYTLQKDGTLNKDRMEYSQLPVGDYKISLLSKDGGILDAVIISVNQPGETLLITDKTSYNAGEPVYVTAAGGKDAWVGIYRKGDKPGEGSGCVDSIYWYYVAKDNHINGGSYDIMKQYYNNTRSDYYQLPSGEYTLILFGDSGYSKILKTKGIKVKTLEKPKSLAYSISNPASGMADGKITVTITDEEAEIDASSKKGLDILLYWADKDGNPLSDYTALAKRPVTGKTTSFRMTPYTIIPEGAESLIAYVMNGDVKSSGYAMYKLPDSCKPYKISDTGLNVKFQVISDFQINKNNPQSSVQTDGEKHLAGVFSDIAKINPEGFTFVVGDMADTGHRNEYEKIEQELARSGLNRTSIYYTIGNHDYYGYSNDTSGTAAAQKLFEEYAGKAVSGLDKVYYSVKLSGYTYIVLGSEQNEEGLHAVLSETQLSWFEKTLEDAVKSDSSKPVFVFLHQSLKETVAGSFDGQGWDGISSKSVDKYRSILQKYSKNIILFNGHSHWTLDSDGTMHAYNAGGDNLPAAFNTASTAYLWTSYYVKGGEYLEGSQGYYIRLYDDKMIVMGRDFLKGKYIPSAIFVVPLNK